MGARILVIEDNPTNLELISYLLTAFGHQVETAADGFSGLETARRFLPELIICDIQMPDINGYEVARQLKEIPALAKVPRVAVTALAMVDDRRKVIDGGFDGYITKPIEPENFLGQIEPFLPVSAKSARPERAAAVTTVRDGSTPADAAVPIDTAAGIDDSQGSRILVIDNSPDNIRFARGLLEPSGYRVESASDIATGLSRARRRPPALFLCDLHMPGGSGFDLLTAVKADPELRPIPFVILSSTVRGEGDRRRALALGADNLLFRSIEPHQLLHEIESLLARGNG